MPETCQRLIEGLKEKKKNGHLRGKCLQNCGKDVENGIF